MTPDFTRSRRHDRLWSTVRSFQSAAHVHRLHRHRLFQSSDGGKSWSSSTDGIPEMWRNTTYWLAFDPSVKGRVWGAFSGVHDLPRPKMFRSRSPLKYTGGVGISNDGGVHWTPSGTGMPSTSVTHILMDPESAPGSRTLYATAFGRGVYKSADDGKTWTLKNTGIDGEEPFAWRITRATDGTLYLIVARRSEGRATSADGTGALYRSTDKAEHWERMALPEGVNGPTGLTLDPRNQQRMYLTAWGTRRRKRRQRRRGVRVKGWRQDVDDSLHRVTACLRSDHRSAPSRSLVYQRI